MLFFSFVAGLVQPILSQDQIETENTVTAILADWEALPTVFDDVEIYARQIRQLAEIGKPAVPLLTAALDKTSRDTEMRLLAFTLRAIGDPRAVPALIRAIPKTLLPPGSDCGMSISDPEVLRFMQSNDLEARAGEKRARRGFGMGRPVREVCIALQRITGTNQNESEIFLTFLEGGEQQRLLARNAFYRVARNWADWWKSKWNQFVNDPSFAEVKLPVPKAAAPPSRFLTGPNVKTTGGMEGVVIGPIEEHASNSSFTLSANRRSDVGGKVPVPLENSNAWAARAGVDLLGTEYRDRESGKRYFCLRGVGLQAWEIPNKHWATIEEDLQQGISPLLEAPAGDLLMHYDAAQARYAPEKKATFLFITRDGNQGILRLTAQVTRRATPRPGTPYMRIENDGPDQTSDAGPELGVKIDYKFFYTQTEEMKAEDNAQRDAVAARRQVRERRKMTEALNNYPHISGTVYLPNGLTASNATVMLSLVGETAFLGDRRFEFTNSAMLVHTPADGRFLLPKVPKARALYAVHEGGFMEYKVDQADQAESPLSIILAPWGRIEGTLIVAGKPASREKMAILNPPPVRGRGGLNLYLGTFKAESDEQGRFVFPYVPAGEVQICRLVRNTFCEGHFVKVKAGETTMYQHGFDGRTVRGHLVTSDQSQEIDWKSQRLTLSTKPSAPKTPTGEDPDSWTEMYWQSVEGKERLRNVHRFALIAEANGDFRIDDVPVGTYQLRGELHEGAGSSVFARGKPLGRLNQEIIVPDTQANQSNEPLDLGNVVVQMVKTLKAGDRAPDFEAQTVDGKTLRLADFRGKYVLLDFWATWCGPCRAETPNLKVVYNTFGANPRFAMIGLSLDRTVDAPIKYAEEQDLRWHQGFLGDRAKTKVPDDYGVEGIPATFLIDPAGKVMATELVGTDVGAAVGTALGKPQSGVGTPP